MHLGASSQLTASPEAELGEAETNALQKPWHLGNLDAESYAAAFYFSTADDAGADAGASKWSATGTRGSLLLIPCVIPAVHP